METVHEGRSPFINPVTQRALWSTAEALGFVAEHMTESVVGALGIKTTDPFGRQ